MAVGQSPRTRQELKRKIAELERVRSQMRLDIVRIHSQPGQGSEEDLAYTENSLILVEEELRDLVKTYDEGGPS